MLIILGLSVLGWAEQKFIPRSRMLTFRLTTANLEDSMKLASKFAQPYEGSKVAGRKGEEARKVHHKLEGIDYSVSEHGCPLLDAGMAWLECEVEQFVPIGDHTLVVGRVVDGRIQRDAEPLTSTFTGWTYSG